MFILYAIAIGLVLGLVLGGRPAGLATLRVAWAPVIVLGLLAQVVLFSEAIASRVGELGPALYVGSTLVVVAAVLRNWRIPGMPVVIAGALCNLLAVVANGGSMPSTAAALAAAGKALPAGYSNSSLPPDPALWPLTDVFALPHGLPMANVFSVGDVLIGVGVALVIVLAMRRPAGAAELAAAAGVADATVPSGSGTPEPGGAPGH